MSKIYQALGALTQGLKSKKEVMVQKKSYLTLALGLSGIVALLIISSQNNNLFMDRLLVVSGILSCILLVKTMDNR
jgi:hypothetical protein